MLLIITGKPHSGKSTLAKNLSNIIKFETDSKVQFRILDEDYMGDHAEIINWCLATNTPLIVTKSTLDSSADYIASLPKDKARKHIYLDGARDRIIFKREADNILVVSQATSLVQVATVLVGWIRN